MTFALNFHAPPTVASFAHSDAFFRLIAGPIGSGKTTGCIMELLRRAIEQSPGVAGTRFTRFAIVRQTLKQLKDTVLKDILDWLGPLADYRVSEQTVYVRFGDVHSEWLLIPLDSPEDQRRLLSMQLTGAWFSEAIEMTTEIIQPVLGRCGRFPSGDRGQPSWFGGIADTNMPTEGSDWHKLMEVDRPPNWHVFIQPGGMEPDAENLNYLLQTPDTMKLPFNHPHRVAQGRRYYENNMHGQSDEWVQRYVHAKYGPDPSGSPVFRSTFRKSFHTIRRDLAAQMENALEPSHGYPLIIGQDFGRNPCALIGQSDHKGRLLILQEIVSMDVGLEVHLDTKLQPTMRSTRFMGRPCYVVGDPSGMSKNSHYEETSFDLIKRKGLNAYPAPTNALDKRLRATEALFLQQRDGGPAILIDYENCPTLVLALESNYRFAKRRNGQLQASPEKKNPWSDLADCLQYMALAVQGGMAGYVATKLQRPVQVVSMGGPRRRVSAGGWT